jgi:hypothetical protein
MANLNIKLLQHMFAQFVQTNQDNREHKQRLQAMKRAENTDHVTDRAVYHILKWLGQKG